MKNRRSMFRLLSDSQRLPAGNLLFWGHFRQLITGFGAQIIILGDFQFGNFPVLVLGNFVKSADWKKITDKEFLAINSGKNYLFKPEHIYLGNFCGSDSNLS